MVLEDHPINQQVILSKLHVLSYEAGCGAYGGEALNIIAQKAYTNLAYGIGFRDSQMPVLDGYEAMRQLHATKRKSRHIQRLLL